MFERIETERSEAFEFTFDGQTIPAHPGDSIASALLAAGLGALRSTPRLGRERGAYCMMGVCFDCLVQIDGETVQACMTAAQPGLSVERVPRPERGV